MIHSFIISIITITSENKLLQIREKYKNLSKKFKQNIANEGVKERSA